MLTPTISFDKGSLILKGDVRVPHSFWDNRTKSFRSQGLYYRDIIEYLNQSKILIDDNVQQLIPSPNFKSNISLRGYQNKALQNWIKAGKKGTIVLPTGSGKTIIAIKAIEEANTASIIIVPTLDLLEQWRTKLIESFNIEIGVYGGGTNKLESVTVATYNSAYLRAGEIGNRFGLIIFDEVHHLPAEGYKQIAEMFTAQYRMGLTATFEREDMLHNELPRLIGGIVFKLQPSDLAGSYLAEYSLERINVDLSEHEKKEYDQYFKQFTDFLIRRKIKLTNTHDFRKFIMITGRDKSARQALLSRNKALEIAFNSETKIQALKEILKSNLNEQIIIFTQHNQLVHRISKQFLLPYITYLTSKDERNEILSRFKDGRFWTVVTSKVLDEGIDVPKASLGIIVSGTGSSREFIQRLGRLLRKDRRKKSKLIELVSKETTEMRTSWKRKRSRE